MTSLHLNERSDSDAIGNRRKKKRKKRDRCARPANQLQRHTSTDAPHTNALISYLEVKFLIKEVASESVGKIQDRGDDHTGKQIEKRKQKTSV